MPPSFRGVLYHEFYPPLGAALSLIKGKARVNDKQTSGRHLSGAPPPTPTAEPLEKLILQLAAELAYLRPLLPYPGWRFDAEWDNPDHVYRLRRQIWTYFRDRGAETPFDMPWYHGLRLRLFLGNELSRQVFIGGCIEPNEMALFAEVLRPGMVFIDVGANEGIFTLLAAAIMGPDAQVIAIEPSSREYTRLLHNLVANKLTSVSVCQVALSDRTGQGELVIADAVHSGHNTLGAFVHEDVYALRRELVDLRKLDDVVKDAGMNRVDVVKIDAEGAEARILYGASEVLRRMRPLLVFEALPEALERQGNSLDELLGYLGSLDYHFFGLDAGTGRPAPLCSTQSHETIIAAPHESTFPSGLYAKFDLPVAKLEKRPRQVTVNSSRSLELSETAHDGVNSERPYLSVVVASRNDDHGGALLQRMQTFVNAFVGQCCRHSLSAELILVEWNPPPGKPSLAEALQWPVEASPCQIRIIEVSQCIHSMYKHADALPLYQMIAKNVGIRRARGQFILATNIDILLNDELVRFLAAHKLRQDKMYRIDRYDVMSGVPVHAPVAEQLSYCATHLLRINSRDGTYPLTPAGQRLDSPMDIRVASVPGSEVISKKVCFVSGWYPPEQHFGEIFRWAGHDAVLAVDGPSEGSWTLALEMEPGPSCQPQPLTFQVIDGTDQVIGQVTITKRAIVLISIPDSPPHGSIVRIHTLSGGRPLAYDPRILNFRVFRCQLIQHTPAAGMSVEVWPVRLPARIRSTVTRFSRLFHSFLNAEGEQRISVPFTGSMVRWLDIQVNAGGLSFRVPRTRARSRLGSRNSAGVCAQGVEPATDSLTLHTNACGDFTLMARECWHTLRGYPEFDAYSFNLDALLCIAAHHAGIQEEVLKEPMRIYHIEHAQGSGWTPEGERHLFKRLAAKGIPYLDWKLVSFWASQMRNLERPMIFNRDDWGLRDFDLREICLTRSSSSL